MAFPHSTLDLLAHMMPIINLTIVTGFLKIMATEVLLMVKN